MMKAESSSSSSSINPSLDEQRIKSALNNVSSSTSKATTMATKIASSVKRSSKFLPSILSPANLSLPPSQSLPSNRLLSTTTNTNTFTNSSSTCISASSSSLPAVTSTTATNVFTNNFPPSSCCCRQMMTISGNTMMNPKIASTSAPVATASTIASNCNNSSSSSSCKKSLKSGNDYDWCFGRVCSRITSSKLFRQLLPISLCILSFATVLSILIVYMDTTEIRHQQFKLNMSRDYELYGVPQDDPTLIAFLREIHMKKYPMNFLKNTPIEHYNFTENHELTPEMAKYIATLVNNKMNGIFIQSMTGSTSQTMTAPWLAETLNWSGLIIEPEPRRYFSLRKQNAHRQKVQVVHACLSPSGYPKEVRIHNDEDSDVRINSLIDDEPSWFNSRVKCFPLYTLMLAINKIDYDLLSLGCPDHELQILQTLPFNKVNIEVISIHLTDNRENVTEYIRNITKFLLGKSYKLQTKFLNNYIYQKINSNSTNRLRNRKQSRAISSSSLPSSSSSAKTTSNTQQQTKTTTSQTTIMTKNTAKTNQQKSQ